MNRKRFAFAYALLGSILLIGAAVLLAVVLYRAEPGPPPEKVPTTEFVASAIINQLLAVDGATQPLASCAAEEKVFDCTFSAVGPNKLTTCWRVTLTWITGEQFNTSGAKIGPCPEWMNPAGGGGGGDAPEIG